MAIFIKLLHYVITGDKTHPQIPVFLANNIYYFTLLSFFKEKLPSTSSILREKRQRNNNRKDLLKTHGVFYNLLQVLSFSVLFSLSLASFLLTLPHHMGLVYTESHEKLFPSLILFAEL